MKAEGGRKLTTKARRHEGTKEGGRIEKDLRSEI
jgi:hypothetical protein